MTGLTDDQRNQLYELRFEACNNDETCVHSDDPRSMRGTHLHHDTCPAHPDNQECST